MPKSTLLLYPINSSNLQRGGSEICSPISWLGCLVNKLFFCRKPLCLSIWLATRCANKPGLVTKALSVWHGLDIGRSLFSSFLHSTFMDGFCIRALLGIGDESGMNSIREEWAAQWDRQTRKQIIMEPSVIEVNKPQEQRKIKRLIPLRWWSGKVSQRKQVFIPSKVKLIFFLIRKEIHAYFRKMRKNMEKILKTFLSHHQDNIVNLLVYHKRY